MESHRQQAYLHLIYRMMLDVRGAACVTFVWWRPRSWARAKASSAGIRDIMYAFHNLAYFAAREWEHFDEATFWHDVKRFKEKHPHFGITDYEAVFNAKLTGDKKAW